MKDIVFKSLPHAAHGFKTYSSGKPIADGYKPDFVMSKGNEFIIMECDTGTSRKGYLGGLVKAAKFLTKKKTGRLIYFIKEKDNTTVYQIANHLESYYEWIKDITNLNSVSIIAVDKYCPENVPLKLYSKEFRKHARIITIKNPL